MEDSKGKIVYVMGKSASGKDTIYKELHRRLPELGTVTLYTTRPMRDGEKDGVEYFFVDNSQLKQFEKEGKVIECRTYQTVYGPWNYFTADDGQINLKKGSYLVMGTLESYEKLRGFYGKDSLIPIYIYVEDGLRLRRALEREERQKEPKYEEMCRRFLADEKDFSQENLKRCGIGHFYENIDLEQCLGEITEEIKRNCPGLQQ